MCEIDFQYLVWFMEVHISKLVDSECHHLLIDTHT